jgi:hypothetical protein
MGGIDPTSRILAHIRAQAVAWRRRPLARPSAGADAPAGAPRAADWLAQVAQSVIAIPRDAPDRSRRAFRAYLQALLARECGVRRVLDPEFQDLVDRVIGTMETDANLRDAMRVAGDTLLESAQG